MHTIALVALLASGGAVSAQTYPNGAGTVRGHAADGMRRPYTDYIVTVRDAETGGVIGRQTLDGEGNFAFVGLSPKRVVIVELKSLRQGGIVWTGGPYVLSADRSMTLALSVGYPAQSAAWVMAAAGDVPTVMPLAVMSGSR